MLPPFDLVRPADLASALAVIDEDHVPYCGGTELLLAMRAGLHRPEALVDVKGLPELTGVRVDGEELVVGAAERHMDVAAYSVVRRHAPMLARVEHGVGNARVRAQGSVGGNLCFAEPKSDVGTALIALGASVTLVGPTGTRVLPVRELIAGPYYADKEPDELLVDVRVPLPPEGRRSAYVKYQTMERPTLGVAVVADPDVVRVVVGAVGEVPEVHEVPGVADVDPDAIAAAVDPTPDLSGSEEYKRHVTGVYVRRALQALEEQR